MLKKEVLRNKKDFSALYTKGRPVRERSLILIYRKNGLSYNRRAFLASKKVGNSVIRNRARRLLKESFRSFEKSLKDGYDMLFIARNSIIDLKFKDVKKSMSKALTKGNLVRPKADIDGVRD